MTGRTVRCARCDAEVRPDQARTVEVEHGTSASPTLVIHDRPEQCAPVVPVRRTT